MSDPVELSVRSAPSGLLPGSASVVPLPLAGAATPLSAEEQQQALQELGLDSKVDSLIAAKVAAYVSKSKRAEAESRGTTRCLLLGLAVALALIVISYVAMGGIVFYVIKVSGGGGGLRD
jgi:hypothetical protein